jgi:hypothetical protein
LLFDPKYLPIILATLVGFTALAAALLVPIYRFLDREQEVAEKWTPEQIAERLRKRREEARAQADEREAPEEKRNKGMEEKQDGGVREKQNGEVREKQNGEVREKQDGGVEG